MKEVSIELYERDRLVFLDLQNSVDSRERQKDDRI